MKHARHLLGNPPVELRHLLVLSDGLWLAASFYLSYRLLPFYRPYLRPESFQAEPFAEHAWLLLLILPLWYVLAAHAGLHGSTRLGPRQLLPRVLRVTAAGLAGLAVLIFAFKLVEVSRLTLFGFCALSVPVWLAGRLAIGGLVAAHRAHIYNTPRVLLVGTRTRAREFLRRARHAGEFDCHIVGCLDPQPDGSAAMDGVPVLGSTDDFDQLILSRPVDVVVFALPLECVPRAPRRIAAALELGLRVAVLPELYLPRCGYSLDQPEVSLESLFGQPAVIVSSVRWSQAYRLAKRAMDLLLTASLLVLLAPLMAIVALAIKLTSPADPVLYRWRVLGRNGQPILSWKFRTMVPDADRLKTKLVAANEMDGPVFKMRDDPRVTPLGRWLRRYSLDELPQLWSVVRGDLSLVGPRPPFPEEAARYQFWQRRKLSVKPGITCLWQVNGRNHIHRFDDWARLDLEYVRRASLWLDCKILLKTIPAVLRGRGAY